jgi:pilus assembly protein TadC
VKPRFKPVLTFAQQPLEQRLLLAGVGSKARTFKKVMIQASVVLAILVSAYIMFIYYVKGGHSPVYLGLIGVGVLMGGFIVSMILLWLGLGVVLDLRMFNRTKQIEEVLPDFLQLTATNVRAGMTIDRALWLAIRPRFGILAHEIETVAKEVMSGAELPESLRKFSNKYDSLILKRSINLLIEGINAGSEVGDLLNRTSQNIQEVRTIQKEMAANVTSYSIFITFAAIVALPALLALSKQLIVIISGVSASIGPIPQQGAALSFGSVGISPGDFGFFAILICVITSTCSAMIIAIIHKGTVKEGLKNIPTFIAVSLTLYFICAYILGFLLTGIFS